MDDRIPQRVRDRISPCPTSGCWFWMGSDNGKGHGKLDWRGSKWLAHRLVWTLLRGPICGWLVLDHKCRVRSCVNPDHLEPVPHEVNTARGRAPLTQFRRDYEAPISAPLF